MTLRAALVAAAVALLLVGPAAMPVTAQDGPPSSTTTTVAELPPAEIIPRPNSGHEPEDAGDRGGALQLLVLGLVVAAVGGGVWKIVGDVRRARPGS